MTTELKWYFENQGQTTGPVTEAELRQVIARGELVAENRVWHEGMGGWKQAGEVPNLLEDFLTPRGANGGTENGPSSGIPSLPSPIAAAPVYTAAASAHYTGTGMPRRAMENLRGHAHPVGDISDWPLDDTHLIQLQETLKIRKKIMAAAGLYRFMLVLTLVFFVICFVVAASALLEEGARNTTGMVMLVTSLILLTFCVFYYFMEWGTRRSKTWAPLTVCILAIISCLFQILSLSVVARAGDTPAAANTGLSLLASMVINLAFAWVSIRAILAIPKYLAKPAWCQEVFAKAGA